MKPKLVIFDFDGVIVNSEDVMIETLHKMLKDYKIDMGFSECCEAFIGNDTLDTLNKIIQQYNPNLNYKKIFNKFLDIKQNLLINVAQIPYVKQLLKSLVKLKIPYCIASNSSTEHIDKMLTNVKLNQFFSNNKFSAAILNKFKPEPAVYLEALNKMGAKKTEALAIEDSVPGVKAANAAKIPVIGLLSSPNIDQTKHSELLKQNGAFTTTTSLKYVLELINS